jgi:hypothetical protein
VPDKNKAPGGGTEGAAVGLTKLLGQQQPKYSSIVISNNDDIFKPSPRQLACLALHEEWDGNYTYNENQLISYADIEAMVSALSKCRDIDVMLFTEELEAVATGDAVMLA